MILGLIAAQAIKVDSVLWARIDGLLRYLPLVALGAIGGLFLLDGATGPQ